MNITIEEFKQLSNFLAEPIKVKVEEGKAVTIRVKCRGGSEALLKPIEVEGQVIAQVGVYRIKDIRFWVVKE